MSLVQGENQKCYIMVCKSLSRLLQMQERSLLYSHVTWQSMLLQKQKCKSACMHNVWTCDATCRLISFRHALQTYMMLTHMYLLLCMHCRPTVQCFIKNCGNFKNKNIQIVFSTGTMWYLLIPKG